MPSRGQSDYWLSSFDYNLSQSVADAVYIDEPYYSATVSASLITGAGFTDSTLINRNGFSSLQMREQFKRLRQLFIDHGRRPFVWIDASNGFVAPHMWAFVEAISDGEGIGFSDGSPDFVDRYNTKSGIDWLMGISRAAKYGWVSAFLDEITCCVTSMNQPAFYRSMIAMLQLHDVSPVGSFVQNWVNYMQPRVNFNITAPEVSFTGYWNNTAIIPDTTAKCSYYSATNKVLAHCANLSATAYSGNVGFNAAALGLSGTITAKDAETGTAVQITNGSFPLTIGSHNYRVIQLTGSSP